VEWVSLDTVIGAIIYGKINVLFVVSEFNSQFSSGMESLKLART
jgi:hypothetical protein